jgi:hypothetical protein
MAKSHRRRRSTKRRGSKLMKTIRRDARKALPVVASGLKTVGSVAKNTAVASVPIAEKGVSTVYGTLAEGFDLGVKGVSKSVKNISKLRNRNRNRKTSRY